MENGAGFAPEPRTRHDPGWPNSLLGGLICVAVMVPAVVLVLIGASPFGDTLRRWPGMQAALRLSERRGHRRFRHSEC
jgi:hypothetical protein